MHKKMGWWCGCDNIATYMKMGSLPLLETCNLHEDHHFLLLFLHILDIKVIL